MPVARVEHVQLLKVRQETVAQGASSATDVSTHGGMSFHGHFKPAVPSSCECVAVCRTERGALQGHGDTLGLQNTGAGHTKRIGRRGTGCGLPFAICREGAGGVVGGSLRPV